MSEFKYLGLVSSFENVRVGKIDHKINISIFQIGETLYAHVTGESIGFKSETKEPVEENNINKQVESIRFWLINDYVNAVNDLEENYTSKELAHV